MISWLLQTVIGLFALYGLISLLSSRNDHEKNAAIMWVLQHSPNGMYARDICMLTGISNGSIYLYLSKLEDRKMVRSTRDHIFPHRFRYHFVEEHARAAMKEAGIEP